MPLAAGTRLGPYEVIAALGAGGMGEVYRARDTRLERAVAIKVSQQHFSERFEREARAVAALNHPNICTLYDVGPNYLVMEYIEGQTLGQVIPSGGMRLGEALKIATRIADGLAAAHAAGIVHRDLKPGNVMVTESGTVKLLDFGLATQEHSAITTSESLATRTVLPGPKTIEGTIVGTFSYMSPEQAEGRKLDARSDIFSFGSLLYEMLTGKRAFQGETTLSTLAAILNQDPRPPAELVPLPRDVERIVQRCLRKDPARRFQHASDLRVELEELVDAQSSGTSTAAASIPARRRSGSKLWPLLAALALAVGGLGGWLLHRPPPAFHGPQLTRMTYDSGLTCDPALSPDGKLLAYASDRAGKGTLDIWVQPASGGDAVQLTHDGTDSSEPSFSPDGSRVVYRSERDGGGLYVVSALGGDPRLIAREGRSPRFSPDGTQIAYWTGKGGRSEQFARQGGRIFVVPAAGGEPRQLASKVRDASTPAWSPDGRKLLFAGWDTLRGGRIYSWYLTALADDTPLRTNADEILSAADGQAPTPFQWLSGDRVLFSMRRVEGANLYRIGLDAANGKISGKPERLTFGGGVEDSPSQASDGRVAVADLTWNVDVWSVPADTRAGRVTGDPIRLTDSLSREASPSVSQDGRKLVFLSVSGNQSAILLRDLATGKSARVLSFEGANVKPWISQDGSMIAYSQAKDGNEPLYVIPASGGLPQRLSEETGVILNWTASGSIVRFSAPTDRKVSRKAIVFDPKRRTSKTVLEANFPPYQTSFSPDEKWITFMRLTSAQTAAIMIAPATGPWPVPASEWTSVTDGTQWDDKPRWSPDGNLLYFTSERDGYRCIWAQRLDPRTRKPAGTPFTVYHSHSSRRSLRNVGLTPLEVAVGPDKIVFLQGEVTGNIWIAKFPKEEH